jgi:hypothetical protein
VNLDSQDPAFEAGLEAWLSSLPNDVLSSFDEVIRRSPGYYPTTLRDGWSQRLKDLDLQPIPSRSELDGADLLPVGHPLDYDWRFTEETREFLLSQLNEATQPGELIVYLGTPTLFIAGSSALPERRHLLIDANHVMVEAARLRLGEDAAVVARIGVDEMPANVAAAACVLDPPWYPEDSLHFLAAASSMLGMRGAAFLSQPTTATRPGIETERVALGDALPSLGFRLDAVRPRVLRYVTPHFERMSLLGAEPALVAPNDWRSGDLLRLSKIDASGQGALPEMEHLEQWHEVSFGPVRIKLRDVGGEDLGLLEPNLDRLTTVSRRDPRRAEVGFWTSGNRVRALSHAGPLAELIAVCDAELRNMTFTHTTIANLAPTFSFDQSVAHALTEILLLEYQEHVAGGYGVIG